MPLKPTYASGRGRLAHLAERGSAALNRQIERLLCLLGLVMAIVVAAQVFSRYLLNHSLFWSEELARYLLVWMTFLGASVAYRRGAHPGIDAFVKRLPAALRPLADRAVHLVSLTFFAVMIVYGVRFAWFVRLQISPALSIPKWTMMAVIPVSGLILALHAVTFLIAAGREKESP